jgi:outer membrane protein assembly factor BamB
MIPFSSVTLSTFTWSNLPKNQGCELWRNGGVVGKLLRPGIWSSDYVATSGEKQWTFRRSGFWGNCSDIVESGSQQAIAAFKCSLAGRGTLTFTDGEKFEFLCHGLWRPVWSVMSEKGQPVLALHSRESFVEVTPDSGVPDSRLSLLALFALYRVRQAEEDAASAAIVA